MKTKVIPTETNHQYEDIEGDEQEVADQVDLEDTFDDSSQSSETLDGSEAALEHQVSFSPPLYRQRYLKVAELLADDRWKDAMVRIIDFGCAECKLTRYLTRSNALSRVREICHVDIDGDLLRHYGRNAEPLFIDLIQQRPETALVVKVMEGDITQVDSRLKDVDAVVAIELIEHLEEDTLKLVPESIFGQIKPKLVILTTPNREFNVAFENFEGPFRHYDHKFEFTRLEFEEWVQSSIINRYPEYKVEHFSGVGEGPIHLGFCSQYVVIVRKDFFELANNGLLHHDLETSNDLAAQREFCGPDDNSSTYRTITEYHYPMSRDTRTREEKLYDDCHFLANQLAEISEEWASGAQAVIQLVDILDYQRIQEYNTSVQEIARLLEDKDFQIVNGEAVIMPFQEPPDDYDEDNDDEEEGNFTEAEGNLYDNDDSWD